MNLKTTTLAAASLSLFAGAATAQTTYAGPFTGNTVVYSDVQDQNDLFGAPTLSGDTLSFTPQGFSVEAAGDRDFDFEDGFLSMLIEANPGLAIPEFTLTEAGAYRILDPFGSGTAVTGVDVKTIFAITVLATDDGGPTGQILSTSADLFSADATGSLGSAWKASVNVNIQDLAEDEGVTGNVTKVRLTLDNQLTAVSEDGTLAFIDKKGVSAVSIAVPEPTSAMVVLGAGALLLRRRISA